MAGHISESPREPKQKTVSPIVVHYKVITSKEIQMVQACMTDKVKFEYVSNGLKIGHSLLMIIRQQLRIYKKEGMEF